MDKRRDAGEFYPDGKVIATRPIARGGDMKHSEFEALTAVPARFTDTTMREKLNQVIGLLKGGAAAFALTVALDVLLGAFSVQGAGVTVETAPKGAIFNDEPVVTNVVFNAAGLATPEMVTNIVQDVSPVPDFSPLNATLVATIEATAPAPGDYATVSNRAMNAVQTETDPVWNAEKSDYATKAGLSTGQITVNSAEYADNARDAYNAEYAVLAEGLRLRDYPKEIYADAIFAQLDAATETNALQDAAISSFSSALSNKLDKSGGTLSGGITVWGDSTFYGGVFSFSDTFKIKFMDAVMTPYFEIFGMYDVNLPFQSGTLALVSDIPTTMAWSAINGKPTTISGYGITDALKSDFTSLTNNAAFTSAVAAVSPPTDTSELEARGFVRIVADDEIYFVTITTTQTEE